RRFGWRSLLRLRRRLAGCLPDRAAAGPQEELVGLAGEAHVEDRGAAGERREVQLLAVSAKQLLDADDAELPAPVLRRLIEDGAVPASHEESLEIFRQIRLGQRERIKPEDDI